MEAKKMIEDWAEDYAYLLKEATLMFFHKTPPDCYTNKAVSGKAPVILIPGIFGTWASMKRLGDKISSDGHPVYAIPDLGNNIFDIPSSAEKLGSVVEKIASKESIKKDDKKIILVAHSKGGLIGKYFLSKLNQENKVSKLIAIATPFSGSSIAKLIELESFKELDTESGFIKELSEDKGVNEKIVSIIPKFDNHVWSENGSFLDGAENIKVDVCGHHKILFDEKVENLVVEKINSFSALN